MASCGATAGTWRFTSIDWLQSRNSWISQHTTTFAERLKMCPCPFVRAVQWSWRNPLFDNGMTTVGGSSADTDGRGIQSEWKKTATNTTPYLITIIFIFLQLGPRIVSDRRGVLSQPGTLEKNGEIFHTSHFPYLYGFFNDKLILSNLQIRMVFSAFNCSGKLTKLLLHCTNVNTHLRTLGGWSKSQKDPVAFAQPSDAYGRVHSVTMATPRNRSSNGTYEPTAVSRLPLFFVAFTQSFSLVNLSTLVHSPSSTVICHFCVELQCIGICSPYIGALQFASLEIALQYP